MALLRLIETAQPLFPNQRNNERIFVFSRQHYINYAFNGFLLLFLSLIPTIIINIIISGITSIPLINGVYIRDLIILATCVYYIVLTIYFMLTWIVHYYNVLIITDQRVVEIKQEGLFNRDINELSFEQVQDVSSHTVGILSTLFDAGDIEIQTAGSLSNFHIKNVPRSNDVVSIISALVTQTKEGVPAEKRSLTSPVCGIIDTKLISANAKKPALMNSDRNLYESSKSLWAIDRTPRTIREKFDYWWWHHKIEMSVSFGPEYEAINPDGTHDKSKINLEDF